MNNIITSIGNPILNNELRKIKNINIIKNDIKYEKELLKEIENKKINYLIIDRRNNYDVDEKEDYKNLNRYVEIYEKANKYVNCKKRIDIINEYLVDNIETKNITKMLSGMEEIMYERGEI